MNTLSQKLKKFYCINYPLFYPKHEAKSMPNSYIGKQAILVQHILLSFSLISNNKAQDKISELYIPEVFGIGKGLRVGGELID